MEEDVKANLNLNLTSISNIVNQDAIIIAVGHRVLRYKLGDWVKMLKPNGIIIDVKSICDSKMFSIHQYLIGVYSSVMSLT